MSSIPLLLLLLPSLGPAAQELGIPQASTEAASDISTDETLPPATGNIALPRLDISTSPIEAPTTAQAVELEVEEEPAKEEPGTDIGKEKAPIEESEDSAAAISTGPACRALHLTSWVAGTPNLRRDFLRRLKGTVVNAVVIPLKETDGRVYIPGVAKASEYGSYLPAIPDPRQMLSELKEAGLRVIARIVVFKDNYLARRRPDGKLWRNQNGIAWTDPYQRPIWDYNLGIAVRAAQLGFDEIQFDYIRFPSDGNTKLCRYSNPSHSRVSAIASLREFLEYARKRMAHTDKPVSIAVFGLTTTVKNDMGIGQEIGKFAHLVDYISPMMYPSHYARKEYGLSNPNREPYKIILWGLRDAKAKLKGRAGKLRPYLQDFSIHGVRYGPAQVRAQILAAHRQGVDSWILWNPRNNYTWDILTPRSLGVPVEAGR
ncbi:MAG: putative glycoside hydrolase [Elusimicrobia bacterium]|nr:putative glycoside hydrolase [Elusimicrobiota bacterium]